VSRALDVGAARARCEAAQIDNAWVEDGILYVDLKRATPDDEGRHYDLVRCVLDVDEESNTERDTCPLAVLLAEACDDLPAALDEIEALREALADARTSALEEAAAIADGYCGDGVALDQWTPRGDGERTRADIAREIRAAISAPRGDA
jgi:hypothetical protein